MSCSVSLYRETWTNSPDVAIANNNGGGGFFCICTGGGTTKGGKGNKMGEELHNYIDIDLLCRSIGLFLWNESSRRQRREAAKIFANRVADRYCMSWQTGTALGSTYGGIGIIQMSRRGSSGPDGLFLSEGAQSLGAFTRDSYVDNRVIRFRYMIDQRLTFHPSGD